MAASVMAASEMGRHDDRDGPVDTDDERHER
jgi:hypothetical protein